MCKPFSSTTSQLPTHTQQQQELLQRIHAVPPSLLATLGLDPATATHVELAAGSELYQLVCNFLVSTGTAKSYTLDIGSATAKKGCCDSDDSDGEACEDDEPSRVASKDLGLGIVSFTYADETLYALQPQATQQTVAAPAAPAPAPPPPSVDPMTVHVQRAAALTRQSLPEGAGPTEIMSAAIIFLAPAGRKDHARALRCQAS